MHNATVREMARQRMGDVSLALATQSRLNAEIRKAKNRGLGAKVLQAAELPASTHMYHWSSAEGNDGRTSHTREAGNGCVRRCWEKEEGGADTATRTII